MRLTGEVVSSGRGVVSALFPVPDDEEVEEAIYQAVTGRTPGLVESMFIDLAKARSMGLDAVPVTPSRYGVQHGALWWTSWATPDTPQIGSPVEVDL